MLTSLCFKIFSQIPQIFHLSPQTVRIFLIWFKSISTAHAVLPRRFHAQQLIKRRSCVLWGCARLSEHQCEEKLCNKHLQCLLSTHQACALVWHPCCFSCRLGLSSYLLFTQKSKEMETLMTSANVTQVSFIFVSLEGGCWGQMRLKMFVFTLIS